VGLNTYHSFALNTALQFVLIFPTALILELIVFENSEDWVTFSPSAISDLTTFCDPNAIIILLAFGVTILLRPITAYQAMTNFNVGQQLNVQAASFFLFFLIG
jgi:hypothetical protein